MSIDAINTTNTTYNPLIYQKEKQIKGPVVSEVVNGVLTSVKENPFGINVEKIILTRLYA